MGSNAFLQETLGALQAVISVLLTLIAGAGTVRYLKLIDQDIVDGITKLSTNIFLPCMLFTEMGKESSWSQLKEYWVLPVFTISLTLLSLLYATIGVKLLRMPNWIYPAAAFPNMLSLPLLLIESLGKSGAIDKLLLGDSDTIEKAIARGRVYFLVNGLAGNIIRFAVGPYLLRNDDGDDDDAHKDDDDERRPLLGGIRPGEPIPNLHPSQLSPSEQRTEKMKKIGAKVKDFFNPPLVAGLLAITFGLISPLRRTLFEEGGALNASVAQSLISLGKLYTALQIFVLGGKLVAKESGRARIGPLLYLFLWRFCLVPIIAMSAVYGLRQHFPNYAKHDPMLDFVLAISHVGPPAITLAAMADMSGLDATEQGVIATVLLASYLVTPTMSLSVSGIMAVVDKLY